MDESNPEIKGRRQICPECHHNTLSIHLVRKTGESPPYKSEQWEYADCLNCGYSRALRQIAWDEIGDNSL